MYFDEGNVLIRTFIYHIQDTRVWLYYFGTRPVPSCHFGNFVFLYLEFEKES